MQVHDIILSLYFIDYGDKDNMDLAERFSISTKKDDYPAYLLFLQGQDEPIRYKGDAKNADDIKKFLMKESGLDSLIALKFYSLLLGYSLLLCRILNLPVVL